MTAEESDAAVGSFHPSAPRMPRGATDAYLILQDLCHLIAGESTVFLLGLNMGK